MKNKKIFIRRFIQILFLIIFLFKFIKTQPEIEEDIYRVKFKYSADNIFFRSDPLIILSAVLSLRRIIPNNLFPVLFNIALSIFFARWFCGWVCPLGTCIDIAVLPLKKKSQKHRPPFKFYNLKYYFLFVIFILAFLKVNISGIFDPITILFRTLTFSIDPPINFLIRKIFDPLGLHPQISRISEPVYQFLSNSFLTFQPYFFRNSLLYFTIFLAILLMNIYHKRLWCRWLCPLGAIYGLFGKIALCKRDVDEKCIECGLCAEACKMGAISTSTAKKCEERECIYCLTCDEICPEDAISFPIKRVYLESPKVKSFENISHSRRNFIISVGSIFVTYPALKFLSDKKHTNQQLLRPPGVRDEDEFQRKCSRCGVCMRVCPRNALHPSITETGLEGLWSPVLIPRMGYCEYYCNLCPQVCPTKAIPNLSGPQKRVWKIGLAKINEKRCIPWRKDVNCSVCEEACPLPRKAIVLKEKRKRFQRRGIKSVEKEIIVKYPYVLSELCIGCGICENKCPVGGDAAIQVFKLPPS